jgi:hypothetical protein
LRKGTRSTLSLLEWGFTCFALSSSVEIVHSADWTRLNTITLFFYHFNYLGLRQWVSQALGLNKEFFVVFHVGSVKRWIKLFVELKVNFVGGEVHGTNLLQNVHVCGCRYIWASLHAKHNKVVISWTSTRSIVQLSYSDWVNIRIRHRERRVNKSSDPIASSFDYCSINDRFGCQQS